MINEKQIKNPDHSNASKLLANLIDADIQVEQQINNYIAHYGVTNFFSKLDTLEFPAQIIEKLNAVKAILDVSFLDVVKEADIHARFKQTARR